MKRYIGISGSWKTVDELVEKDVTEEVTKLIKNGDCIVTGGALGVDFIATELVLALGEPKSQLQVYLPISLDKFCTHYEKRADEGVISRQQAGMITTQLRKVFELSPNSILGTTRFTDATVESYCARSSTKINACHELYAFQVNNNQDVQDAIDKANMLGKKVKIMKYNIVE